MVLGQQSFKEQYEKNMIRRAQSIASSVTSYAELLGGQPQGQENLNPVEHMPGIGTGRQKGRGQNAEAHGKMHVPGGGYINLFGELLKGDIWIVDRAAQSIQVGQGKKQIEFKELNEEAVKSLQEVFQGKSEVTGSYSTILGESSLTASVPVFGDDGEIVGAVLLHEVVNLGDGFFDSTVRILLLSTLVATALVMCLAVLFAGRFIKPLNAMDQVAKQLIAGDYTVKSGIVQQDEIGNLAKNLDLLSDRLDEARKKSDALEQLRRDFISNISHELRTPVTVMRSSLEALREGIIQDPNEVRDFHEVLYEESLVLERLISDLLELTGLQNENFPLSKVEVNLIDILSDAVRSQRQLAVEKAIELRLETKETALFIVGDYTRLRQMFITVINNAVKFSDPDETVRVEEDPAEDGYVVRIINRGPVIPPEQLEHIFQSFYRAEDVVQQGFGLGLAIAKQIATRHAIEIDVTCDRDEGTCFIFLMPGNIVKY